MHAKLNDVGAYIAAKRSVAPQSAAAGTVNGASIDRLAAGSDCQSAIIVGQIGAISGAPDATSVGFKIQHSDDNSTFVDYNPDDVDIVATVTAANTLAQASVDLMAAKRYIRLAAVSAYTGGTTPSAIISGELILGGARRLGMS